MSRRSLGADGPPWPRVVRPARRRVYGIPRPLRYRAKTHGLFFWRVFFAADAKTMERRNPVDRSGVRVLNVRLNSMFNWWWLWIMMGNIHGSAS